MNDYEMQEINTKVLEELVCRGALNKIIKDFGDGITTRLVGALLKNGCPAKAILKTLGDKSLFGGFNEEN